ncbi:carbohydrate ABC transporter permease [Paenibacillus harenae]|uniref:carbohydrate ABC transporter permease n=1 Tax=Paenibacillus harenae TaxID=306543 RepID=UPI0003FDAFB6|nr:carbohydrate ABC transporter permease [Paenibacillus harenae]
MTSKKYKVASNILHYSLLSLFLFIFLFPTVFMIVSSLKLSEMQILSDMSNIKAFVPYGQIGLDNYFKVLERMNFSRFFLNSVIITGLTIIFGTIINSMFAYALAKLNFGGQKVFIPMIVALIIIPVESVAIPMLLLVNEIRIVDTYIVQIVPFLAESLFIFLFYQFFRQLPNELQEAAIMDGAGYLTIYRRIILPLSRPVIATVVIFYALGRWGDLLWPILVTRGEEVRPLPLAMQTLFITQSDTQWGQIFAFATMMSLPLLILFVAAQKQFIRSVASSGIKG